MRLLHVVHQYLPAHTGGTELYTHWLARDLQVRGHTVSVFHRRNAAGTGVDRRDEDGVCVYAASAGRTSDTERFLATFGDSALTQAFEHVLDETRPDVVHVQHLLGLPAAMLELVWRRALPLVITLHDYWWICANAQLLTNYSRECCDGPQMYLNCTRCVLARADTPYLAAAAPLVTAGLAWRGRLLRRILDRADALVASTNFVRDWYVGHGADPEKTRVLVPGIDPPSLPIRTRHADGTIRFLYVGGLAMQKGVHVAVQAFRHVEGDAELWIAGDTAFDPEYTAELRAGATPRVRFLGRLSRDEVWQTLATVDVVLVPSLWYETFCFVIHEAFAAGVPVFASALGALRERVNDGVDGRLLPAGDVDAWGAAMQHVVDAPDHLERLHAGIATPPSTSDYARAVEAIYTDTLVRTPS